MQKTRSMLDPEIPVYCENPKNWSRAIEEEVWLNELGAALAPFIAVADQIPFNANLDALLANPRVSVEQWLMLRKVVTGSTNVPRR